VYGTIVEAVLTCVGLTGQYFIFSIILEVVS
jgi:hypothetical protein